jgi:hypothetical protein
VFSVHATVGADMSKKGKTIKLLKKKLKKAEAEIKKLRSGVSGHKAKAAAKQDGKKDVKKKSGKMAKDAGAEKLTAPVKTDRVKTVANEPIAPAMRVDAAR